MMGRPSPATRMRSSTLVCGAGGGGGMMSAEMESW